MTPTFTVAQLKAEVIRLAEEHPDAVYEGELGCYYTKGKCNGSVGCIFGQALLRLQPDLKDFLVIECDIGDGKRISYVINALFPGNRFASYWFASVQTKQDAKCTWKNAVALANAED